METLANLESFIRSADCGSFSAAARQLGVTPAAASRNVAMLERKLRVRLFQRSSRSLALTEDGERFLASITDGFGLHTVRPFRKLVYTGKVRAIVPNNGNTMDRLEAMSIVLTAVETGSLSAAARQLNTPLATVSRKVTQLEEHLQTKLFNRSARKLVLTDAGSSYVAACKRILADISEAERTASGEYTAPTGELVVAAGLGLGRLHLIPILTDFFKAYPDIDVRLVLSDRIINLVEDHVDVALRTGLRTGKLADSNLIALRVGAIRRVVCACPAYLKARGTPLTPDELAGHDCISYAGYFGPEVWTFVRGKTKLAVPVHSRLVVGSVEAACDAARAGIGITTATSSHVKAALDAGTLTTLLDDFQPPAAPVSLVYAANRFLPIKVRAFLDFVAPRLKAHMALRM